MRARSPTEGTSVRDTESGIGRTRVKRGWVNEGANYRSHDSMLCRMMAEILGVDFDRRQFCAGDGLIRKVVASIVAWV